MVTQKNLLGDRPDSLASVVFCKEAEAISVIEDDLARVSERYMVSILLYTCTSFPDLHYPTQLVQKNETHLRIINFINLIPNIKFVSYWNKRGGRKMRFALFEESYTMINSLVPLFPLSVT